MASYVHGTAAYRVKPQTQKASQKKKEKTVVKKKRHQKVKMSMDFGSLVYFSFAVIISVCACVCYLQLRAEVTQNMQTLAQMKASLYDLEMDNNAMESTIMMSIDLDKIKDIAMNELGMMYPTPEQIITYEIEEDNYMDVYVNIEELEE